MMAVLQDIPDAISHGPPLARLRSAAGSAAFAAALMLFFGFVHLARPTGEDLFGRAALVLYYTLRVGGLAFVAVALILYLGRIEGLILDAVLAFPCGAILILCGLAMLADGGNGINSLILIAAGTTFFPSGWRNGRDYRLIRRSLEFPTNQGQSAIDRPQPDR